MERQIYQLNDENTDKLVQAIEEQTSKLASLKGIDVKPKVKKKPKQAVDKDRQIYQQKKNNNEKIVEAIKENTEVLVQVVRPQDIPEVDLTVFYTKEEVRAIADDVLSQLSESVKTVNNYEHTETTIEPDYGKIENFIKAEISKIRIPKPKDGISPAIDVNSIVISVLEKIPKQDEIAVDYKKIERYCAETIERMERGRSRILNSAGPTTRLTEMADIIKEGQVANSVLVFNGSGWAYAPYSAGSSVTLKTNGTNNGSQSVLNLKQGTNVTIADDGIGGVTISGASESDTLQTVYNRSTSPEITTNATRGALTIKRGSTADTDNVLETQTSAGVTRFSVTGNGRIFAKETTTNAAVFGDITGNARGTSAVDIQSTRSTVAQVASGSNSIAIGIQNTASGSNDIAIGTQSNATGGGSTAIGYQSSASASQSGAIGFNNNASGANASAFGMQNQSSDSNASAFGYANISSGINSSAFGGLNVSSNSFAIGLGFGNTASGYRSTASGYRNYANNALSNVFGTLNNRSGVVIDGTGSVYDTGTEMTAGISSTNVGIGNQAGGNRSNSFGFLNISSGNISNAIGIQNTASGYYSTASGNYNTASSYRTGSFGYGNNSSGLNSNAFGYGNTASNSSSASFGNQNTSSGYNYSSAFGNNNTASNNYASAFGYNNTASGYYSSAFGYSNQGAASGASAFGRANTASGIYSSAFGYANYASNTNASAFGFSNTASGYNSTAFGSGIANSTDNSVEIGASDTTKIRVSDSGSVKILSVGAGLEIAEGTNARMGIATLAAGTAVVNTNEVTANSRIFLTRQTISGTLGSSINVTARTAGSSFTITSQGSVLETSTVAWMIVEPS